MTASMLVGHATNAFHGTINAAGTLTNEIDVGEYAVLGLVATTTMTPGTLTFQVATASGGTYYELKDSSGTAISIGPVSGVFAIESGILTKLAPYRYVKIKTSIAQPSGLEFTLPAKA